MEMFSQLLQLKFHLMISWKSPDPEFIEKSVMKDCLFTFHRYKVLIRNHQIYRRLGDWLGGGTATIYYILSIFFSPCFFTSLLAILRVLLSERVPVSCFRLLRSLYFLRSLAKDLRIFSRFAWHCSGSSSFSSTCFWPGIL